MFLNVVYVLLFYVLYLHGPQRPQYTVNFKKIKNKNPPSFCVFL